MRDQVVGILVIVVGIISLAYNKKWGGAAAAYWSKALHRHYSDISYRIGYAVGGALFVLFGLLLVAGIIHMNWSKP